MRIVAERDPRHLLGSQQLIGKAQTTEPASPSISIIFIRSRAGARVDTYRPRSILASNL